ncbi:hypothetical protein B0H19DRAFT_1149334 [Mycena capillaripes]|nr:hypothetical protein B0H19DRAFT_1149334 [Mycena capillaripes]
MFLRHWMPSHKIALHLNLFLLAAVVLLFSAHVEAWTPDTGVCQHCPTRTGITLDTEADNFFLYCQSANNNGSLVFTSYISCPEGCCADGYNYYASQGGCVLPVACFAGQYTDSATNTCGSCPANTYSVDGTGTSCTACPAGQTSSPGSSACTQHCAAGQFVDGDSCSTCPAGTYSGAEAISCSACPANTFSTPGSSSCTACPSGSTSDPGSSTCTQHCAAGQFINGDLCSTCAPGTYSGPDATSCSQCPANTFSAAGASSCTACPNGGTCAAGSTHPSQCVAACPAGNQLINGMCKACPAGTFSSMPNAVSCNNCPADTYSDSGAKQCTACDAGFGCEARSPPGQCKRKPQPGCPPGLYLSNHVCRDCPRDTYGPGGYSPCITCPRGEGATPGSSTCTPKPAPSHRPRAQEILRCPRAHMLCPIYGSTLFECVNVQTSLESCGGCVGMGTDSEGRDCSAIEHVADVRCIGGRCEVMECRDNYEASATKDSCVTPQNSPRRHKTSLYS